MENIYKILLDKNGCEVFKATIEWTDEKGNLHKFQTDDSLLAETTLSLLTGALNIAELE